MYFSKEAVVRRKLRSMEGKRISDFQSGEVAKVKGSIKYVGDTLTAPLSGRKCAFYHVLVEERRSNGKNSHWVTIIEEEIASTLIIKDGNSYALIETKMIKNYLLEDAQYSSGFLNDASETLQSYLKKHDRDSVSWIGLNNAIRYKEGILEEGELIAVTGKGNWKRKSEIKLDIPAEKILVIGAHDNEPVYFSDDPVVLE
ncbi:MAG: hypothetical protein A3F72_14700 [Bacteroidetes bacterium RIFCSPLOWO2_12_FULL_35_15]|nr:MAG: hypothetical protein A3F72_14700 [Bacteroidetes bacterium RIFCSPLOWO2_12_FULL_35_15]